MSNKLVTVNRKKHIYYGQRKCCAIDYLESTAKHTVIIIIRNLVCSIKLLKVRSTNMPAEYRRNHKVIVVHSNENFLLLAFKEIILQVLTLQSFTGPIPPTFWFH